MDNWHWIDGGIVLCYLSAILFIGFWMGRKDSSRDGFLVGNRQIPWFAVLGSLVATEVSAATFLAVPGVGFSENLTYLQFGIGSLVARFFVAWLFLRAFFAGSYVSIYEYLRDRFGIRTQRTAALYFIATRLLASGVRLMIAVTGVSVILGIPFLFCLGAFLLLTLIYTASGGIRAVIWTDCIQAIVFIGAGLGALLYLGDSLGWKAIWEVGLEADRWKWIHVNVDSQSPWWNQSHWWLTAILFGFLSTTASLGTDQDLAQRLLTSKNQKSAARSLILSGFIAIPIAALFLVLGVALFSSQTLNPDAGFPTQLVDGVAQWDGDKAFSYFILSLAQPGLKGLLLAGVLAAAMSSLDSAMAALSASASTDLTFLFKRDESGSKGIGRSRWLTLVFALTLGLIAFSLKDGATFLWLAFKITALTYGPLLGIFLLGLLSKGGGDRIHPWSMVSSTVVCVGLLLGIETGVLSLAWTWLLPIGAGLTILISLTSRMITSPNRSKNSVL